MNSQKIFLCIVVLYIAGFFAHALYLKQTVYGDGRFYYAWMRSVIVDHDIDFRNEYRYLDAEQPSAPSGLPGNKYAIGPALFWTPAFLTVHSFLHDSGYELPYQLAVGWTSVSLAIVGLLLLWNLLKKSFDDPTAIYAVAGVALATSLLFYGSLDVVNTHALTFFMAIVYLTLLFEKEQRWLLIGLSLGILGTIRLQDSLYGILALPFLVTGSRIKSGMTFLFGCIIGFLPQMLAWQALYGQFWVSPYLLGTERFFFTQPHMVEVLFSPNNGLFLWTPLTLVGFLGLFLNRKSYIINPKLMILVICLQIYLVGSWIIWWQGASYSGRMFVSMLPLFAFGIATMLKKYKSSKYMVFLLVPLNVLLLFFFLKN